MSRNGARPKQNRLRGKQHLKDDTFVTSLIDKLTKFEEFQTEILPALQADIKAGKTPEQLRRKYAAIVQARLITTAIASPDEGKALSAARDIIDRNEGKPTERKEITHKYADMSEEELDALLQSEEEELSHLTNKNAH